MRQALDDLVVIDRSHSVAGEYCARLMADYGAEVWLDESAGPSPTAAMGPFDPGGRSLTHLHLNRGKRLGAASRPADVVLCGPDERPEDVRAADPKVVAVRITAFGDDGPKADWTAPEIVLQAASGMMISNGVRGREPLYGVGERASYAAGQAAYIQTLVSLRARRRTGTGDTVRIDAAETAATMCFPYVLQAIYNGTDRRRGDQDIPAGLVRCRGSWVCLWVYSNRFAALCRTYDIEHCITDPRFAEVTDRVRHWPQFFSILEERVADRDPDAVVAELQAIAIIAARAFTVREIRASHHLAERGFWQELTIAGQTYVMPRAPFLMSRTPARTPAQSTAGAHAGEFDHAAS